MAWKIWRRRNELIFNIEFEHPNRVVRDAQQDLQQLLEMEKQQVMLLGIESSLAAKWEPPPLNTYKLNGDAAVNKIYSRIGICVIARDYAGKAITTLRIKRSLFPEPLLAKSYGALQATIFGLELELRKETLYIF